MTETEEFLSSDQQKIAAHDTLERYSGSAIRDFQRNVILTNFPRYVDCFASARKCEIYEGALFKVAHCKKEDISLMDFKIGSPAAALVVDLCAFLPLNAVLFLGMCGGLRQEYHIGEYFVPVASVRGDGTSDFYFPPEVPALANFTIQKVVTDVLDQEKATYHIGITHTTNKRFWEFNPEFRAKLKSTRPQAVEMECATLFTAGYAHHLPLGALLLISDLPFMPGGMKTKKSSQFIFENYMADHIEKGVKIVHHLDKVKRLKEDRK